VATVAEAAGVSPTLVSFVFNDRPGVAAATRKHVLEVASHLGYAPDPRARELRTGKATTVGLIVRNVANPFFNEVLLGLQDEAEKKGLSIVAMDSRYDPAREMDHLRALAARRPAGLVLVPVATAESVRLWESLQPDRAVVVVNATPEAAPHIAHVAPDNVHAVRLAFDHLWDLGHRRIGLLCAPPGLMADGDRLAEYERLCAERGTTALPLFASLMGQGLATGLRSAFSVGVTAAPTAIITNSDHAAAYVYHAVRERGWEVGREVSVVGHDDLSTSALLAPGLTTIRVDLRELGRQAYARIAEPALGHHTEPVSLVVRGSTGPPLT
jgi:LacI family transcriptional regulator